MTTQDSNLRTILNQDGAVILNSSTGTITTLNSTGALVWQALERGEDPLQIARDLTRETGELIEASERDVQEFVRALRARQLLVG